MHANGGGVGFEIHYIVGHGTAEEFQDTEFQGLGGAEDVEVAVVAAKREGDFGVSERDAGELLDDMFELDVVALEELAAHGGVVEEVAHREVAADGGRDGGSADIGAAGHHLGGGLVAGATSAEGHLRYGGHARQRFATEAVTPDRGQIFRRGDLAGRVPFEAQDGIGRTHTAAIVYHLDQSPAGIGHHHFDVSGAGVDRILHQLLHHRSGPLHHFSGGDHIGQAGRQYLQLTHLTKR